MRVFDEKKAELNKNIKPKTWFDVHTYNFIKQMTAGWKDGRIDGQMDGRTARVLVINNKS